VLMLVIAHAILYGALLRITSPSTCCFALSSARSSRDRLWGSGCDGGVRS
jgi:hypothetical protein